MHRRGALTVGLRDGKARPTSLQGRADAWSSTILERFGNGMIKAEWGTKRTCPKCATRFYDLGKDDPVTCINCGNAWAPEPILKSKQPMAFEVAKTAKAETSEDLAGPDEDLDIVAEDEEPSADDEVDLGGDEDLGVETGAPEEEQ